MLHFKLGILYIFDTNEIKILVITIYKTIVLKLL